MRHIAGVVSENINHGLTHNVMALMSHCLSMIVIEPMMEGVRIRAKLVVDGSDRSLFGIRVYQLI